MKKMFLSSILLTFLFSSIFKAPIFKTNALNNINFDEQINIQNSEFEQNELDILNKFKKDSLFLIDGLSCRNSLWEKTSDFVGAKDKLESAKLWATGIKETNGTLLYLISTDELRIQLKNLFKDNISWIVSDNESIIQDFKISKGKKREKNHFTYNINFTILKNDSTKNSISQTICVKQEGEFFKVCEFSHLINK